LPTIAGEILQAMLAPQDHRLWYGAQQLDNVRQVVLVSAVRLAGVGVEQIVTRGQLKGQAGGAPNVGGIIVRRSQKHLDRSVLTRLNVLSEVMVLEVKPAVLSWVYFTWNICHSRRILIPFEWVHYEILPPGQTVYMEYYLCVMRRLREAILLKRPELWATTTLGIWITIMHQLTFL